MDTRRKADKWPAWFAPGCVFVFALVTRLWQIDLARFADDQATLLGSAALIVSQHIVPSTDGLSFTVGFRHPPLTAILLALPVAVSHDPMVAAAFMGVLDALAALLVFLSAQSLAGPLAGLFAGLLYALQPAAVVYGRTIWNPDFVPFFAALAVFGLIQYWHRGSTGWQGIALLAIGCGVEVHPQMAALLPIWLGVTVIKRRLGWSILAAMAALGLTLVPYLQLQLQDGSADLNGALAYLGAAKQTDGQVFAAVASLFSVRPYSDLLQPSGSTLPAFSPDVLGWCWWLLLALALVLVLARRRPAELIVGACFLLPVCLSIRHTASVAPHYLLLLLPVGAILVGLALAANQPRWLAGAIVGLISLWSGYQYVQFQLAVPDDARTSNYGMPLRYTQAAAALASAAHIPGPLYVADADEYAGTLPYLLSGQMPVKRFDGRYTMVFPQSESLYLADATSAFGYKVLTFSSGGPSATVKTPSGDVAFGLFKVPVDSPQKYDQQAQLSPLDIDVAHAARLRGYSAIGLAAGKPSPAIVEWQVTDSAAPTPGDLRQFGHLLDASGASWSTGIDVRGYPRSLWQTGDVVLTSFELGIKSDALTGGYWLETGFYEPVTGQRLPQYVGAAPAGTAARIGPLKVLGISPTGTAAQPLATFGAGELALLGAQRGSSQVVLRWQALRTPRADYTVFVHALNSGGEITAQADSPPRAGSYPTSLWDAGEVVDDPHSIDVPPGGTLELGLYTQPDIRRLLADDGSDHVTVHV